MFPSSIAVCSADTVFSQEDSSDATVLPGGTEVEKGVKQRAEEKVGVGPPRIGFPCLWLVWPRFHGGIAVECFAVGRRGLV